ncbi:hypothetical protein CFI11_10640 [Thalassococcus sp. S3]|nr:hypothetical protein CFI11_10640 [Thalassococcus sp. S3]
MVSATQAGAQSLTSDALAIISESADAICGEITNEGFNRSFAVDGEVNAELKGLAKRLADAGIEGSASFEDEKYTNVLREQLGDELKDARSCRLEVFRTLVDELRSDQSAVNSNIQPNSVPTSVPSQPQNPTSQELFGFVVAGPYLNCSVQNEAQAPAMVTQIRYSVAGYYGPENYNYPCVQNCQLMGYQSNVFSGPVNQPHFYDAQCSVVVMR